MHHKGALFNSELHYGHMVEVHGRGPLLGSNHKSCSCQSICLTLKLSHINLNLYRWHISTDMNPDKDLTQEAPNATFSHVYVVSAGQASGLNLSKRWIDVKKWTFLDCGKKQTLNMKLKRSGSVKGALPKSTYCWLYWGKRTTFSEHFPCLRFFWVYSNSTRCIITQAFCGLLLFRYGL